MADRRERSTRSSSGELSRRERSILRQLAQAMGLGEVMAALMVVATGLSAYATWCTASIANAIYHVGDRPYLGVQDLRLDRTAGKNPRILVEYRNLGDVQAYDVVITKDLMIDDHPVAADTRTLNIGIDSPKVPHFFALELSPQFYEAIGRRPLHSDGSGQRQIQWPRWWSSLLPGAFQVRQRHRNLRTDRRHASL